MVDKIIRDYIRGGKAGDKGVRKLTVPGFGTFMRKSDGEVIFVDLLRGDDGLLRQMVEDRGHYSEVEAMVVVDRFIFEVKDEMERTGSAIIDGFGTLTLDEHGVYNFDHSPKAKPLEERAVQSELFYEPEPVSPPAAKVVSSFDDPEEEYDDEDEQYEEDEPVEKQGKIKVVQRPRPQSVNNREGRGFGFLVTMVVLFSLSAVGYGVWVWIFSR